MCINTEGSYNCSCKPGYSGDGQVCTGEILFPFVTYEARTKLGPVSSRSGLCDLYWEQAKDEKLYCPSDCQRRLDPDLFLFLVALRFVATPC